MKQSYRMLIGRQFVVGDEIYTVCEIARHDSRVLVEAMDSKPAAKQWKRVRFPLDKVLESLLVEEEIELYQPNFLGVSGTS